MSLKQMWILLIFSVNTHSICMAQMNTEAETQSSRGGFNQQLVEELALYFAEESYRKLRIPLSLRVVAAVSGDKIDRKGKINELREDPPLANAQGVVYPFGDKNPLSFVYNDYDGSMTVWERFIKKRGAVGFYGLTAVELAVELNQSSSQKKDRAGGHFGFDATRDALSLKIHYTNPPTDRKTFYKEVDRLVKTQLKWTQSERFLQSAIAAAQRNQPPLSATARQGEFQATLLLRHFSVYPQWTSFYVDRYLKTWDRKHGVKPPMLVSDKKLWLNQLMNGFVHFQGAQNNSKGESDVTAEFQLKGPGGELVFEGQKFQIWDQQAPPPSHLQIGKNNLSFSFDKDSQLGDYELQAEVCDHVANSCLKLSHSFQLLSQ